MTLFTPCVDTVDGLIERLTPIVRGESLLGFTNHFGVEARSPGMRASDAERTMRLFSAEVPVLRDDAARARAARLESAVASEGSV